MSDDYDAVLSRRAMALSAVLHDSRRLGARRPLGTTPTSTRGRSDGPDVDRFAPMGDWMQHAACRDANPAVFDVHSDDAYGRGSVVAARTTALTAAAAFCARCPVIERCAQEGTRHESGVWGGEVKDGGRVVSSRREPRPTKTQSKERVNRKEQSAVGTRGNTRKTTEYVGSCNACDKFLYLTARDAKQAGKYVGKVQGKQAERGPIRTYTCPEFPNLHHWGHDRWIKNTIETEARASQAPILRAMAAAMSTTKGQNTMTATISDEPVTAPFTQAPRTTPDPVRITPQVAQQWLDRNTRNRQVRENTVRTYADMMAAGKWGVNGDSIRWSVADELLDGQHRLLACVKSGATIEQFVTTGLAAECQDTVDTGMKRTVGDQLTLRGYGDGKTLGAVAKLALDIKANGATRPSNLDLLSMVESDEVLQWIVADVLPTLPRKLTTRTVLAYTYRRLHHVDPEACTEFFRKLSSIGDEIVESPIKALYEKMTTGVKPAPRKPNQLGRTRYMTANSVNGRMFDVTCFFLAWNAWRKGEHRDMIRPYANADGRYTVPDPV